MADIAAIVARLPELYQPAFGNPSLSTTASRTCYERLDQINRVYRACQRHYRRTVRVLDLGCAQGFFSLALAEQGAQVLAIDSQPLNIALCNALAAERPGLKTEFREASIEDVVTTLDTHFDLLLGLSVFHHVCHEHGAMYTRTLLKKIGESADILLLESALKSEPGYWAASLPDNARWFVEDFALVHKLASCETHLSKLRRPLFFCSNKVWFIGDKIEPFHSWTDKQHELIENQFGGKRRYYFSGERVAKQFLRCGQEECARSDFNVHELRREFDVLSSPPSGFSPVPRVYAMEENDEGAWLVRDLLPGHRLSELIANGESYEPRSVLHDVLHQLVALESAGLYHSDVRVWNVLLGPDGRAFLIDFGGIGPERLDTAWPFDLRLSFLSFALDVVLRRLPSLLPTRPPLLMPSHFPPSYRDWVKSVWSMPAEQWSFSLILERLDHPCSGTPSTSSCLGADEPLNTNVAHWMAAMERHLECSAQWQREHVKQQFEISQRAVQLERLLHEAEKRAQESDRQHQAAVQRSQAAEQRTQQAEAAAQLSAQRTQEAEYYLSELRGRFDAIVASKSWRVTAPIRKISAIFRRAR